MSFSHFFTCKIAVGVACSDTSDWFSCLNEPSSILTDTDHKTHWFCVTGDAFQLLISPFLFFPMMCFLWECHVKWCKTPEGRCQHDECPRMTEAETHFISKFFTEYCTWFWMPSNSQSCKDLIAFLSNSVTSSSSEVLFVPIKHSLKTYAIQSNWIKTISTVKNNHGKHGNVREF